MSAQEQSIPVVNLADFVSGTAEQRERFVTETGNALRDIGFFALEGHGVPPETIQRAYAAAEDFFSRPDSEKRPYEKPELQGQRGFISFGREHAKDQAAPDLKEFWQVGRELKPGEPAPSKYGGNVWPTAPTTFQPAMVDLYARLEVCGQHLLRAVALYLQEDLEFLVNGAQHGDTVMRVIHYPPVAKDQDPSSIRAAAHEDINLITLLCESTAPGLELLQRDGQWRAIDALEGQIVVDAGDMLQNLSNGLLKSTTHRVVNPNNDRARRFSMPFFMHPKPDFDLRPRPKSIALSGGEATFPAITAGDYLAQRLREIGLES